MKNHLERFKSYVNCWIAKKSRKPMCTGKYQPCFRLTGASTGSGSLYLIGRGINRSIVLTKNNVDEFEVIEESEALRLNKLFYESKMFGEDILKETCFRKDGVTPKKCHSQESFPAALYELKLKYPKEECVAYKCSKCNHFHIGKTQALLVSC